MTDQKPPIVIEFHWTTLLILSGLWTLFVALASFAVFMAQRPQEPRFSVGNYYAGEDGFVPHMVEVEEVVKPKMRKGPSLGRSEFK